MQNYWNIFIPQTLAIALGVILAFVLNFFLQRRLLREQNKNNLIELLLESAKTQGEFYANHWENAANSPPGEIFQITEFYTMPDLAGEKYRINNIAELKKKYTNFYVLALGENESGAIKDKIRKIHAAANDICVCLWENKI